MPSRRYGITFDEDIYRRIRLKAVESRQTVGSWISDQVLDQIRDPINLNISWETKSMDEPVKKAIEPDRTKTDDKGRLRKGLGPLPGEDTKTQPISDPYRSWNPAPKPGTKK